jgi:hypothetical protein
MKDQYVGDANDYLKYALLRNLTNVSERAVSVVWMLTQSDDRLDGQRLSYLEQPDRFRHIDPVVFDALRELVSTGQRTVEAIERVELLPTASFASELLRDGRMDRDRYFAKALKAAAGCPLVFFDPDNGLAVASVPKGRKNSSKYLYWDELEETFGRGQSVVVYQHFPRRPREAFLRLLARRISEATGCDIIEAITTAHVAFLVVPQKPETASLRAAVAQFASRAAPHAEHVTVDATYSAPS